MSEPIRYKSVEECKLKGLSLLVSMKFIVWLASTVGMFTGMIMPWLWIAFSAAIIGVRGWQSFMLLNRGADSDVITAAEDTE